jgi:hypothetical protein
LFSAVKGPVQPTPPPHNSWPALPHAPFMQPPPVHMPCPFEQMPPAATHSRVLWSQQPEPSPHTLPSQQG